MTVLTSTGNVNLTSATNWSPAQIPVNGDDLVIGAHTLTLDADLTLDSITINHASCRFAISGTTRNVQATNGFIIAAGITSGLISTTLTTGMSVTLTGRWIWNSNWALSPLVASTGGNLTLRTVGSDSSAVLFDYLTNTSQQTIICSSWTGGTLTTIGRFNAGLYTGASTIVSMSGGTWSHQSVGTNSFGPGSGRICATSGTAIINWTGSLDTQMAIGTNGIFVLNSPGSSSIGQTGDTFLLRNSATSSGGYTALIQMHAGTLELVGQFTGRADAFVVYLTGGTIHWRNQSHSIPATDHCMILVWGGTFNFTGLALSNAGKFMYTEAGAGGTTTSAGTSVTCTSTAAQACVIGTTAFDGKIVVLESSPATLPTAAQVAAGVSYGYSGAPQTGTGLIMDPATLATAMLTSFSSLPEVLVRTTISTLTSQTEFTLTAGSADNDVYNSTNGTIAIITDQVTSAQKAVVAISDYVGSTRTVTLSAAPGFTIATGDLITIIAGAAGGGGGGGFPSEAPANWLKAAGIQDGALTAGKFANNSITAAALATDAVTEIQSGLATSSGLSAVETKIDTLDDYVDTEVAAIKAKTDLIPADIGSVLISGNSNREVLVTGSKHVAADVHEFQTDVIDADALAASAVTEIQSNLATAAALTAVEGKIDTIDNFIDTEVLAIKAVTDKIDTGLVLDGAVYQFTANMLELAPAGGGGGGDATLANQTTIINHLTDIKGTGWSSTTDTLEKIRDSITNALASLIATVGITPGSITGFPSSLSIGDSYTEDCDRSIHLFVRDDADDPITAVGDHLFTDTDFEAVVIITQSGRTGRVTGSATWVDASPSESYLRIELPSSETRRAAIGAATVQILLKWTGAQYTLPSVSTSWVAQI